MKKFTVTWESESGHHREDETVEAADTDSAQALVKNDAEIRGMFGNVSIIGCRAQGSFREKTLKEFDLYDTDPLFKKIGIILFYVIFGLLILYLLITSDCGGSGGNTGIGQF